MLLLATKQAETFLVTHTLFPFLLLSIVPFSDFLSFVSSEDNNDA